jgi:mono/diheme cytochrome c family protein
MLQKLLLISALAMLAIAASAAEPSSSNARQIKRGSYLVNGIAGCADCHTAMLPDGAPDKSHWLQGATLPFAPLHPIPNWASQSPPIAGLQLFKPEDVVTLLQSGAMPNGQRPNPPMPTYHMTKSDAQSVVAYLQSLAPGKK